MRVSVELRAESVYPVDSSAVNISCRFRKVREWCFNMPDVIA